jgi:hypothetical protein
LELIAKIWRIALSADAFVWAALGAAKSTPTQNFLTLMRYQCETDGRMVKNFLFLRVKLGSATQPPAGFAIRKDGRTCDD